MINNPTEFLIETFDAYNPCSCLLISIEYLMFDYGKSQWMSL